MPENRMVVAGGNPVRTGTRKVAPNMATTCCIPIPAVRPHDSRSSGRTTAPGVTVLPSPCSSQSRRAIASTLLVDPPWASGGAYPPAVPRESRPGQRGVPAGGPT